MTMFSVLLTTLRLRWETFCTFVRETLLSSGDISVSNLEPERKMLEEYGKPGFVTCSLSEPGASISSSVKWG